mgnify:CR=1 FL=1
MNYIEWCESVLTCLAEESERNSYVRDHGIDTGRVEKLIWGDRYDEIKSASSNNRFRDITDNALDDLKEIGLLTEESGYRYKLTLNGKRASKDLNALYRAICSTGLPEPELSTLMVIADLTAHSGEDYASVEEERESYVIYRELTETHQKQHSALSDSEVDQAINTLRDLGLIFCERGTYPGDIRINYRGMVWLQKRQEAFDAAEIEQLVAEWETTSVDFKRELSLDTASEKAEFIKDVIGLANTKASGRRWLIVGFDDKSRTIYSRETRPNDPWEAKINQNRIEQLISEYVRPSINVRYSLVGYQGAKVGRLEVLREPRDLPYGVKKSVGDRSLGKRIEEGDVFVRHGSHTVRPDERELQDLIEEAKKASG